MSIQLPVTLNNRYQIYQKLSEGGFGITFLAKDIQTPSHKICVIKRLKPLNHDPRIYKLVRERFEKEAQVLERLGDSHPQIPRLYAYFEEAGDLYLVQEWISGLTLHEKLTQNGIFTETQVKKILSSVVVILKNIHKEGIIHRDIKPENIILRTSEEQPVLIDFGAVKEIIAANQVNGSGNLKTSIIIGTPGFMPTEQSLGRPLFCSDLYSLGLTAIYLLTGKSPEDLEIDPETGEIIWRGHCPQLSPGFAAVLDKAIARDSRDRYLNASAMLEALMAIDLEDAGANLSTPIQQSPPPSFTPKTIQAKQLQNPPVKPKPPKNPNLLLIAASITTLAVGGGASLYFWKAQQSPPQLVENPVTPTPLASTQPLKTNPNIPPQVTVGGKTEQGQKAQAFIDGAWQLSFTKAQTTFNNTLVMKGEYGEMYTQYFDPKTGKQEKLYQKMRLWSVSQGLLLKGDTPYYVGTEDPHPTYTRDEILFQYPGSSKTFTGENCTGGNCFPVTFTYKGKSLD